MSDLLYHSCKGIVPKFGFTIIIEWFQLIGLISIFLDFKKKWGWRVFFNLQLKAKYGDTA